MEHHSSFRHMYSTLRMHPSMNLRPFVSMCQRSDSTRRNGLAYTWLTIESETRGDRVPLTIWINSSHTLTRPIYVSYEAYQPSSVSISCRFGPFRRIKKTDPESTSVTASTDTHKDSIWVWNIIPASDTWPRLVYSCYEAYWPSSMVGSTHCTHPLNPPLTLDLRRLRRNFQPNSMPIIITTALHWTCGGHKYPF